MSLEYIRQAYKVPAYRGKRVIFDGKPGKIVSAKGAHLKIKLDTGQNAVCHPTWNMAYDTKNA